jgi:tetratricopeptide (TPR) repeat protein
MAKYDEAIVCFNMAISLTPTYAKAFNRRALCLYKLGCYEEAIQNFSRAIQLNPTDKNFQNERQKAIKDIKNVVMPL